MQGNGGWRRTPPQKSRKEEYEEHYHEAKNRGESFFPYHIFHDALVSLVVVGVILALAIIVGAETGDIADPTTTSYNPRPEWYFLFLFELLKLFPGRLEVVGAVGLPTLAILVLLALPFIDRGSQRHLLRRPLATGLGIAVVLGISFLTYRGFTAPLVNPPSDETPAIAMGKRVYRELGCTYCHSINGEGGAVGPDLSNVASKLDKEALLAYFADPKAMIPQSLHPKLQFTNEEVQGLSDYLLTLGAPVKFSAEAPGLFSTNCSVCHMVNGSGGNVGPDLSRVGTYRSVAWLTAFIENPAAVALGAKMPGFQEKLSGAQISDLAAYLFSLKGTAPTPAATPTLTPSSIQTPVSSPGPAQGQPSYSRSVQPIFDKYCTACHGAAALGGLDLTTYKSAMTTGNHKPLVIPGNAETSILFQSLRGKASGVSPMPLGGTPLSDEDIATIGRWIELGAPED